MGLWVHPTRCRQPDPPACRESWAGLSQLARSQLNAPCSRPIRSGTRADCDQGPSPLLPPSRSPPRGCRRMRLHLSWPFAGRRPASTGLVDTAKPICGQYMGRERRYA